MRTVRLSVLLSGAGRTLANLLDVIGAGELDAEVVVVGSSKPDAGGLGIAAAAGIPAFVEEHRFAGSHQAYSSRLLRQIEPFEPDLILLAGFLRKLEIPTEWEGRVLNIHPALLPDMSFAAGKGLYGKRVHEAVLESGAARSGATVHVVDNGYDTGPVIATREVAVLPGDTAHSLARRVFAAECVLFPQAIRDYVAEHPEVLAPRD